MPGRNCLTTVNPPCELVRSISTPRIAEGFHLFLLSLYDSLGAAANPPEAPELEFYRRIRLNRIISWRSPYGASRRETTVSRFLRDRSIWTTVPSGPIRTLAGISETP